MQKVLEKNQISKSFVQPTKDKFGDKIGLFGRLFGCWHKEISRPFTIGNASYRACLHCGARKHFDPQTLKTFGAFHYPPIVSEFKN